MSVQQCLAGRADLASLTAFWQPCYTFFLAPGLSAMLFRLMYDSEPPQASPYALLKEAAKLLLICLVCTSSEHAEVSSLGPCITMKPSVAVRCCHLCIY